MVIGITGATGFIGRHVIAVANRRGHEVVAFSRDAARSVRDCIEVRPFVLHQSPNFEGCEAVIHLAAESVDGLWTTSKKKRIFESRIQGTRRVVEAILSMKTPPEVLVCASAIGFYGDSGDAEIFEDSPSGSGFLADTCVAWEKEALRAWTVCRVVSPRIGLVLGKDGGALKVMGPLFRWGLGGTMGKGNQWMSWIHIDDIAMFLMFAVENMNVRGPLNATSPRPVRNREFVRSLAEVARCPAIWRVPAIVLRIFLKEFSNELLDSKRVLPAKILEENFPFVFPELSGALRDIF